MSAALRALCAVGEKWASATFAAEEMMRHWFDHFEAAVSGILMFLMCVAIVVQVFFRYCVGASLDWPEELGRYLFIAAVYIGCSFAEQEDKHLSITVLCTNGGRFLRKWLPLLTPLITATFCILMVIWGIRMTQFVYDSNQVMPALGQPMWIVYAAVPLGMGLMALRALGKFARRWRNRD